MRNWLGVRTGRLPMNWRWVIAGLLPVSGGGNWVAGDGILEKCEESRWVEGDDGFSLEHTEFEALAGHLGGDGQEAFGYLDLGKERQGPLESRKTLTLETTGMDESPKVSP